jgi:DNA-binding beta-propeller fold protein YncE
MKKILGISFIFILVSQVAFSGNQGNLFRTTVQGATLTVYSTIPTWTYPHAGISSSQSGISFSGCSNHSNGQCIFSVSDTQSASLTIARATTSIVVRLCLDGYGNTYNCENVTVSLASNGYVTNYTNGTVSLCGVNTTTGALSSSCTIAGSGFDIPRRIVLNAGGTLAYVVAEGSGGPNGSIQLCQVSATGLLTSCASTGDFSGLRNPSDIAFSPSGSRAYVTDVSGAKIFLCDVNTLTGTLSGCATTGLTTPTVTGIVLNSSGTIAYFSQAGSADSVSYCSVVPTTGALANCQFTGTGFSDPEAIVLNASGTYAYISNNASSTISVCSVDAVTGALSACTDTSYLFSGRGGVVFNATGTFAYIPNFNTEFVYQCNVDSSTGLLSNCVDSGGAVFTNPSGMAFINY